MKGITECQSYRVEAEKNLFKLCEVRPGHGRAVLGAGYGIIWQPPRQRGNQGHQGHCTLH